MPYVSNRKTRIRRKAVNDIPYELLDANESPGHRDRRIKLTSVSGIEAEGCIARFIKFNDTLHAKTFVQWIVQWIVN